MHNFFVEKEQIDKAKKQITVIGKDVNHIKNVLRSKIGNKIEINENNEQSKVKYICEISEITNESIICNILDEKLLNKESNIYINIVQALPKSDKMELIIQKCTELGANEFTPLQLNRCVVKLDGKDAIKKVTRWQSIAEVAAKQCERNNIPKVNEITNLKNLKNVLANYDVILVAYEKEEENLLKYEIQKLVKRDLKIAVIIGPEGRH